MTTTWDGADNLADLGGLPLVDGGRTAHRRVRRSAAPDRLTAKGWRAARTAGLTRVIDLRNADERGRRGEKFARVFAAIADADGPVLVHCAGGRDRTGMVCSSCHPTVL